MCYHKGAKGYVRVTWKRNRKGMSLMWYKWVLWLCLLVVVVGAIAGAAEKAWAVGGGAGLSDLGMEGGETKAKEVITAERPTKLKIAIGVGSLVVAILVVKFL